MNLDWNEPDMTLWDKYIGLIESNKKLQENDLIISIVGKYTSLPDAYLSLWKSLEIASVHAEWNLKMIWIEATDLEKPELVEEKLKIMQNSHGVLVPGGFGQRGINGKMKAIQFCWESKKPYFGICYGMQLAVIEFCWNVLGIENAISEETLEEEILKNKISEEEAKLKHSQH